ncbi:MAG: hypothetical protein B6U89_05810 [Desulfurococcales archaeon ex4484_58]|nr:MAG: hypothetical protein B6U89_05810 [Desulfurococcales archaeon ex4484_58]
MSKDKKRLIERRILYILEKYESESSTSNDENNEELVYDLDEYDFEEELREIVEDIITDIDTEHIDDPEEDY